MQAEGNPNITPGDKDHTTFCLEETDAVESRPAMHNLGYLFLAPKRCRNEHGCLVKFPKYEHLMAPGCHPTRVLTTMDQDDIVYKTAG